jgi:hypothetical protein
MLCIWTEPDGAALGLSPQTPSNGMSIENRRHFHIPGVSLFLLVQHGWLIYISFRKSSFISDGANARLSFPLAAHNNKKVYDRLHWLNKFAQAAAVTDCPT